VCKCQVRGHPGDKILYVASNICGSSVRNIFHVTLLVPRILKWLLDFWKIYGPLEVNNGRHVLNFFRL
jgi:hypothetical protein